MKRFRHFNIPHTWEQYWTQYPEGYTIMESLIDWIGQVNDMTDVLNDTTTFVNDFIEQYDDNMLGKVRETLTDWQDSGFLDVVIDEALQTQLDVLEQETTQRLSDFDTQLTETETGLIDELNKKATKTQLGRVTVDGERIKSLDGQLSTVNVLKPVKTPTGFNWTDHPLVNKLFTDGYGNYTVRDLDLSKFKPVGKTYYVDGKNGSNDNDGLTLQTAFRTRGKAHSMSDAKVLKFAEGNYGRVDSEQHFIQQDLSIEALSGHAVYFYNSQGPDFTPHGSSETVWHTSSKGGDYYLDPSRRDENGDVVKYKNVPTLGEVTDTPGSYTVYSSGTYIHTFDGSPPEKNVNFVRQAGFDNVRINGGRTFYMKGIHVIGGGTPFRAHNTTVGSLRIFMEDCDFRFSNSTDDNAVGIGGAELVILKNCSANDAMKDGFNYYTSGGKTGLESHVIEIDCVGKRNGTDGSDGDQGSTMHQGGKIIRINGTYAENHGANIGDTHDGTQSWNMGCVTYKPLADTVARRFNYHRLGGDMWVEGSLSYDVNGGNHMNGTVSQENNNLIG